MERQNNKKSRFKLLDTGYRRFYGNRKFKKREKPHVPAGMFAQAKSSVTCTTNYPVPALSLPRDASPPRKIAKTRGGWDFSDISVQSQKPSVPLLKNQNSEDERGCFDVLPPQKGLAFVPWSKLHTEEEQDARKNIEKIEKLHSSIDRFSKRLEQSNSLPSIPLQKNSDIMMGDVEATVLSAGVNNQNSANPSDSCKVLNLLMDRSDWLIYKEELSDETDYLPIDPFYSTDAISSDFEEYEREMDRNLDPSYLDKIGNDEVSGDLNSQEDFFDDDLAKEMETPFSPRNSSYSTEFELSKTAKSSPACYSPFDFSIFSSPTSKNDEPSTSNTSKYSFC